ncbi:MAG: M67 family metallopeptidase [Candidatus Nitronauta litoralis]|uniref:M67 family metallopeptidase n=1 Tax=Candidatus Nitronauta litoralis TaxID=2705533 RepID=A0A7T0BTP5_9BACT|nr:MAG: M67 family metallopeptidase [Candidatus Nitronauta litoralis]
MFRIISDHLDEMHDHALEDYPFECCGIVIGNAENSTSDKLFRCTNIQNKLHKMDPKTHSRDARTAYFIDEKELLHITREAYDQGLVIKLFYHSHPEHDAYFSEEDIRRALFFDEPAYPDARYLVISVYNKSIKEQALFEWNHASKTFEQVPVETI